MCKHEAAIIQLDVHAAASMQIVQCGFPPNFCLYKYCQFLISSLGAKQNFEVTT